MYKYIYLKNNKYSINNKNGKNILVKYIQYYLKGGVELLEFWDLRDFWILVFVDWRFWKHLRF